jgi:predicted lipoprotein
MPTLARAANTTIQAAIDGFVRPAYAAFAKSEENQRSAVDTLCAAPSATALEAARQAFRQSVVAWSELETIRFGPVTEQNRLERILFWPDRKSIGLKQVQAALASQDPTASDATSLAGKSVAMQGLGALEFVLHGSGADELTGADGAYRCRFGAAIAANLATISADVSKAWADPDGFASQWANPGPDSALFRTDQEALSELVDVFVQGLEMIRDVRLNGFLGRWPEEDKPRQAIYWRSQATVPSLGGNVDGLQKLFEASGIAGMLDADNAHIGQSVGIVLANSVKTAEALGAPVVTDALKNEAQRNQLDHFRLTTSTLSELIGVRLTGALGLSAGFSSLDGD